MIPQFFKDVFSNFVVIGAGFVLPYLLLSYMFDAPHELALAVGWVCCSVFTARLMAENPPEKDDREGTDA